MNYKNLIETDPVTDRAYYKFEKISQYIELNYCQFAFKSEEVDGQLLDYLLSKGLSPKDAVLVADMMIKEIYQKTRLKELEDQEAWIKEVASISKWRKWLDKINDIHRKGKEDPTFFLLVIMFILKEYYLTMSKDDTLRKEYESRSSLPSNTTNILSNIAGNNLPTGKPK